MKPIRILLPASVFYVSSFVWFAFAAKFTVPYRDDWDWIRELLRNPLDVRILFEPHNEHLIPVARVLADLQFRLEGTSGYLLFGVALLSQLTTASLFWLNVWARWRRDVELLALAASIVSVTVFFTYQLQSIVFGAAVLFPLVQAFASIACASAAAAAWRKPEPDPSRRTAVLWLLSMVAALGAGLTTTNGLAVPAIVALYALRAGRRAYTWAWAFAVLQVAFLAAYVVLTRPAGGETGLRIGVLTLESLRGMGQFFLSFFTLGITYGSPSSALLTGGVLVGLGCWVINKVWRAPESPRVEGFAVGLLLFAIVTAALTAIGRWELGAAQAAQSRYATFAMAYWCALLIALVSWAHRQGVWVRWQALVMRSAAAAVTIGMLPQLFLGLVWQAKAENLTYAALTLRTGVDDDAWLATLHPETSHIYETRRLLREADRWGFPDARLGSTPQVGGAHECQGEVRLTSSTPGPGLWLEGTVNVSAESGLIVDSVGHVVGLAQPMPTVAAPNPAQSDVIRAVWLTLTGREDRKGDWGGFANAGGGPPYRLYVPNDTPTLRCHIVIPAVSTSNVPRTPQLLATHAPQRSCQSAATRAPMASDEVSPGESMPAA